MLIVHVHNEGTRPDNTADYTYKVYVNQKEIASGEVSGHQRSDGWRELLRRVADEGTKASRPVRYAIKRCPYCGEWVAENWYIRHRKSDCKVGIRWLGGGEHIIQEGGGPWHENASGLISAQKDVLHEDYTN